MFDRIIVHQLALTFQRAGSPVMGTAVVFVDIVVFPEAEDEGTNDCDNQDDATNSR